MPSLASHCSYHTALPTRPAQKTRWWGEGGVGGQEWGVAPAYSYWKLSVSQKSSLSGLHVSCSDLNANWHCTSEQKFALPSPWKLCSQPPRLSQNSLCSCVLPPPPQPLNPPYTHTPSPIPCLSFLACEYAHLNPSSEVSSLGCPGLLTQVDALLPL